MSTLAFTSAGSAVYISAGVPATLDVAGFAALSYTKIGDITDLGAVGPAVGNVTHVPVDQAVTFKYKTIVDNGSMALKGARVTTDAGQTILIAAVASYANYAFKVVLQNGAIIYFQGLADSYKTNIGTAGVITSFDCNLLVNGNIYNA